MFTLISVSLAVSSSGKLLVLAVLFGQKGTVPRDSLGAVGVPCGNGGAGGPAARDGTEPGPGKLCIAHVHPRATVDPGSATSSRREPGAVDTHTQP